MSAARDRARATLTSTQLAALVHFDSVQKHGRMMTRQYDHPPRIDVEQRLIDAGLIDCTQRLTDAGREVLRALAAKTGKETG